MKIQNGKYGKHTKEKKYLYKNIFLVGSILHAGNSVEYFRNRAEKLVIFYFLGTLRNEKDFIQVYENGNLIKEKKIFTPRIPLIYHSFIYFWYILSLFEFFGRRDTIYVITFHPLFFLFNHYVHVFRKIVMVFWIADVIPKPQGTILKFYQNLIFYYHKRNKINFYLGNKLNKLMNGKLLQTNISKTVMWGIRLEKLEPKKRQKNIVLCFIGVIRKGHGLDLALKLLKDHKDLQLKILGECNEPLYKYYQSMINSLGIKKQVTFENRYYKNSELIKELSTGTIGIGLYNTSKDDPIYYTDPGKIKTYTQFGLPVIMTNTSEIIPFIKRFNAGEIVEADVESLYTAIKKIMKNYQKYLDGVNKFNHYFEYQKYYDNAFIRLKQ